MAFELGSAIISGASGLLGNLLGGLFGSSANDKANETNMRIATAQNAWNQQMLKQQQQFAVDTWNMQNEYNTPKAQAERLREAGINPLVLGSNGSSPAGAISNPAASPAAGATVHPYDYQNMMSGMGNAVANSVDAYFRNRNIQSVTHKNEAETSRTRQLSPWEVRQLQALVRKGGIEGDLAQTELVYQNAIQGQKIAQVFGDTVLQQKSQKLMDMQILQHDLQNKLFDVQLAYAPKLNEAKLHEYWATVSQIKAQCNLINQQSGLTAEQRLTEAARRLGIIVDNGMKGLDFQIRKETKKVAIETFKEDLESKQIENYKRSHSSKVGPFEFNPRSDGKGYWPFDSFGF